MKANVGAPLGEGIYYRAEAARLLQITPSRLNRWAKGYTFYLGAPAEPVRRDQPPIVKSRLAQAVSPLVLSFLDLMELRVVKALVDTYGVPLQRVRKTAEFAAHHFDTRYPFASRRIFTDGRSIFAALAQGPVEFPDLVELVRDRHYQLIAGEVVGPFLDEMQFDERTRLANRWWPLGRTVPVVLDPRIEFGAPVIEGTRTRTSVIADLSEAEPIKTAADVFRLTTGEVKAANRFESMLRAA